MPAPEPAGCHADGGAFVLPVRVYYEDTDAFGIVYYANYLKFAERARSEILRHFGTDNIRLRLEDGVVLAVRTCATDYRRPAFLDDALVVVSRFQHVTGATVSVSHEIRRGEDLLVDMDVLIACVSVEGKATRLPKRIRAAIADLVIDNKQ